MPAPRRSALTVNLGAEGVADTTAYVLVDLSDAANYPHTETGYINLLGLKLNVEKAADGDFDIWVGVITEVDASNGSTNWLHAFHLHHQGNATDDTDRFVSEIDFTLGSANPDGLRCEISGGAQVGFIGNQGESGNARWKTGTGLASPVGAAGGATGKPGASDLVVLVEEVADVGTLDFSITAIYETHAK